MTTVVGFFGGLLTWLFDVMLWPFRSLSPWWPIVVVSLLTGIAMLWLFGKISNQAAIRVVRDGIRGNLIGIRLFGDDLGLLFRLQARIFKQTLTYLGYAAVPFILMIVVIIPILIQLELRFAHRPLREGEVTVVNVRVTDPAAIDGGVALDVPEGVVIEAPPVKIRSLDDDELRRADGMPEWLLKVFSPFLRSGDGEVSWRVRVETAGHHLLTVRIGDDEVQKELVAGDRWEPVSLKRSTGALSTLAHPGESPIRGATAIRSVELIYPEGSISLFGWGMHWIIPFFVLSLVFAFALRRPMGVEI